jgi:NhaA family Na+:H+ antiporter
MEARTKLFGRISAARSSFSEFIHTETGGAALMLGAAVLALVVANSAWHTVYEQVLHWEAGFVLGPVAFEQSLKHWIDDGLMAVFFFVVGLEIKREIVAGELSDRRSAILPVAAAVGGMVVPALVYLALAGPGEAAHGWGVPMATDIAFAIGALALLGSRVPMALKVFLTALAIADDIGAILVIALFYTAEVRIGWLVAAAAILLAMVVLNRRGEHKATPYLILAAALWFAFLNSGIHATVAGVLAALMIPATTRVDPRDFTRDARVSLDEIDRLEVPGAHPLEDDAQQVLALDVSRSATGTVPPLQVLESALHPFVTFVILPVFAFANAGVRLVGDTPFALDSVAIAIVVGLVIGKPVGITAASWLAIRAGLADLPDGVGWRQLIGAGALGGIGFTMSLFIANLAFATPVHAMSARAAILVASATAAVIGIAVLRTASGKG